MGGGIWLPKFNFFVAILEKTNFTEIYQFMQKFIPQGTKLLVEQIETKNFVTQGNIEVVNLTLAYGEVIEVPEIFKGVYEKGDVVAFPQNTGYSQTYNGKSCLWIDGKGAPDGDVWFISKEEN